MPCLGIRNCHAKTMYLVEKPYIFIIIYKDRLDKFELDLRVE